MRILYVSHGYKPAYRIGGPIISVSSAAEMLVRKGHEVTVFTTNSNMDEDLDVPTDRPVDVNGVEVWYFRREEYIKQLLPSVSYLSKSMGFLYCPKMRQELDRVVPRMDLVHTQTTFVYPTYAGGKAALRHRKPLFYHQRGNYDPERLKFRGIKKRFFINFLERPLMQNAALLFALTEAEVESYRLLNVQTPSRVVPNGIDVTQYRDVPVKVQTPRWTFRPEQQVILFLGRVHPIKGADKLLEAFLKIQAEFPNAVLVLGGPDEFGLEEKFRSVAEKEGLKDRILFPGMVSGDDKLDLLARADLFCLPSDAEGFSMAVLESLASATPVLLSPGCHFPQVEKAGAGRVVPATPDALAAALVELLSDPDGLVTMGRLSREFVSTDYTWDHVTDQLIDVYWEGIRRHKAMWS